MLKLILPYIVSRKLTLLSCLLLLGLSAFYPGNRPTAVVPPPAGKLMLKHQQPTPVIGPNHPDVLASHNVAGFETGQMVKLNGTYHMFVNEMFGRPHRDLRIAYWTSPDAVQWHRETTIRKSIPERTAFNPRSEVWVTGVEFNEKENAWNIFYVAYRAGNAEAGEKPESDYEGKIWRARSVHPGLEGIAGPYADLEIIMQPDANSQPWEGQQAVATFNPYKVGHEWYAFYDGHNHVPKGPWPSGLAKAPALEGPWVRLPEPINPLTIVDEFMENPQVTQLSDGTYITVFDSFGDQEIGYSFSTDGIHWTQEQRLKIQTGKNIWGQDGDHAMRTPLCIIPEADDTFTIVYTSLMKDTDKTFYAVGTCKVALKER